MPTDRIFKLGINAVYVISAILAHGYNYVNSHQLSKKVGLSGRQIAYVLRWLADKGYIRLEVDRRGRFKVYKVEDKEGLADLITNYRQIGKEIYEWFRRKQIKS